MLVKLTIITINKKRTGEGLPRNSICLLLRMQRRRRHRRSDDDVDADSDVSVFISQLRGATKRSLSLLK